MAKQIVFIPGDGAPEFVLDKDSTTAPGLSEGFPEDSFVFTGEFITGFGSFDGFPGDSHGLRLGQGSGDRLAPGDGVPEVSEPDPWTGISDVGDMLL